MLCETPGRYLIGEAEYHADPCPQPSLNAGTIKVLTEKAPVHAWLQHPRLNPWFKPVDSDTMDRGSAAHLLLTQVRQAQQQLVVVDAADWRTKAAKEQRDAARQAGQVPILRAKYEDACRMVQAARQQLYRTDEDQLAFQNGEAEVVLVWREGETWARGMLDWAPAAGTVFYDYKTTGMSASPESASRHMVAHGWDIQAEWYRRGIAAVLGIADPVFRFVVQENEPPFALSIWQPDPTMLATAAAKIERALACWQWCLKHDRWPGYSGRVHHIAPPPWELTRVEDRRALDDLAKDRGEDWFAFAIEFQAPGDAT